MGKVTMRRVVITLDFPHTETTQPIDAYRLERVRRAVSNLDMQHVIHATGANPTHAHAELHMEDRVEYGVRYADDDTEE